MNPRSQVFRNGARGRWQIQLVTIPVYSVRDTPPSGIEDVAAVISRSRGLCVVAGMNVPKGREGEPYMVSSQGKCKPTRVSWRAERVIVLVTSHKPRVCNGEPYEMAIIIARCLVFRLAETRVGCPTGRVWRF